MVGFGVGERVDGCACDEDVDALGEGVGAVGGGYGLAEFAHR